MSDSMMGGIDEEKLKHSLSEHLSDIRKMTEGGCTVDGMMKHIDELVAYKPDNILLHVGTNDCVNITSDAVIQKLKKLGRKIREKLPKAYVYFSLPTMRVDNRKANLIVRNVNNKIRSAGIPCLDHLNINVNHLSKKGLHLNESRHGKRRNRSVRTSYGDGMTMVY